MPFSSIYVDSIDAVEPASWDRLNRDNHPLLSHAFLSLIEKHGCISAQRGWLPHYLLLYDQKKMLVAAMPLYEKHNTWGEFVFDHAWADAYERYGQAYYPKLVAAIPFSPVLGSKLLCLPEYQRETQQALMDAAIVAVDTYQASSFHGLFLSEDEAKVFAGAGCQLRHDVQYHWKNQNHESFEDFLASLNAKKRKNIRQERRRVTAAGVRFRHLHGGEASSEDWANFTRFYQQIYDRKWGQPVFSQAFFEDIAAALGDQVLLVMADRDNQPVAGALFYRNQRVLYGRHWGCSEYIDALHFETCYYQGIEYCIEHGLTVFEPGAQGEHKLARGFDPVLTNSMHWIADPAFRTPIDQFLSNERAAVIAYATHARTKSAYQKRCG